MLPWMCTRGPQPSPGRKDRARMPRSQDMRSGQIRNTPRLRPAALNRGNPTGSGTDMSAS
jgi:hypothetical protein